VVIFRGRSHRYVNSGSGVSTFAFPEMKSQFKALSLLSTSLIGAMYFFDLRSFIVGVSTYSLSRLSADPAEFGVRARFERLHIAVVEYRGAWPYEASFPFQGRTPVRTDRPFLQRGHIGSR